MRCNVQKLFTKDLPQETYNIHIMYPYQYIHIHKTIAFLILDSLLQMCVSQTLMEANNECTLDGSASQDTPTCRQPVSIKPSRQVFVTGSL